jgi:plasmid stabilization system protein ParE
MKRVRVLMSARLDAAAASDWYEAHGLEVAERFRIALDEAVELITELPGVGHEWPGSPEARRIAVRGFPFWVVYKETDMTVVIVGVTHMKRATYLRDL